ncbi:hypothetical protein SAMN05878282_103138 [Aquipseudomonas alcaligenes]|uniref:Uncharacterized protein n=1 Tax=Aquipseudomonas alcaligenes TaxID=43263 RepID=A0A1N6RRH9_AQUAC|nr:hypothetical protein SAMN05878282_103138 [Pseudomonas alcaligenes]
MRNSIGVVQISILRQKYVNIIAGIGGDHHLPRTAMIELTGRNRHDTPCLGARQLTGAICRTGIDNKQIKRHTLPLQRAQ